MFKDLIESTAKTERDYNPKGIGINEFPEPNEKECENTRRKTLTFSEYMIVLAVFTFMYMWVTVVGI